MKEKNERKWYEMGRRDRRGAMGGLGMIWGLGGEGEKRGVWWVW